MRVLFFVTVLTALLVRGTAAQDAQPPSVAPALRVQGSEFSAAINRAGDNLRAVGTLFIPASALNVQAVIVVMRWGNGTLFYPASDVRQMADRTRSALFLLDFATVKTPINNQPPSGESVGGDALLQLLGTFSNDSGHRELSNAPLLFWGHSAAGPFGLGFAAAHPDRTIAFVRYHSGPVPGGDLKVAARTPALFIVGGKDESTAPPGSPAIVLSRGGRPGIEGARLLWESGRALDAPWTIAFDPDADHSSIEALTRANTVAIPWITAILRQRLAPTGNALRAASAGIVTDGNWLPDETTAAASRALGLSTVR